MDEQRRLALWVGLFVVGALAVGTFALVTLGTQGGLLRPRYRLVTYFENVQGLVGGAPVLLAGKSIGTVQRVTFAPVSGDLPPVRVDLQVEKSVADRIRSDSVASIGTIGLLGDKYVQLSMGSTDARVLQPGDEIASVSPLDVNVAILRGTEAIDEVAKLAASMNEVVTQFGKQMGGKKLAEAMTSVTDIVKQIEDGRGLLHGLVYDPYEGSELESVKRTVGNIDAIFEEIAKGGGLLHQLIYASGPEEKVLGQALEAASRLNSVLEKIDGGTGTLGLLVNDPTLYGDMKNLVGGAERSLVVRSLIRLSTGKAGHP